MAGMVGNNIGGVGCIVGNIGGVGCIVYVANLELCYDPQSRKMLLPAKYRVSCTMCAV